MTVMLWLHVWPLELCASGKKTKNEPITSQSRSVCMSRKVDAMKTLTVFQVAGIGCYATGSGIAMRTTEPIMELWFQKHKFFSKLR